ncbi:MAG: DUF433 domain-containing protein [Flavobacteriales bacterium]|nr:DUF433 domain-containing protein [Flavobacteriales bacterium]
MIKSKFTDFETKATIGEGIYTVPELAHILKQPAEKINRWITTFFDDRFAKEFKRNYSWTIEGSRSKAVNFQTMLELVTMFRLSEQGASTQQIVKTHSYLSKQYNSPHPFADKTVLKLLSVSGKSLIAKINESFINADGSEQWNFDFIKSFLIPAIDFDDNIAVRFYPRGKESAIVIDPQRKFGSAVVGETNIYPETFYSLHKAGESNKYISSIYEVDEKLVMDAIAYCKTAA